MDNTKRGWFVVTLEDELGLNVCLYSKAICAAGYLGKNSYTDIAHAELLFSYDHDKGFWFIEDITVNTPGIPEFNEFAREIIDIIAFEVVFTVSGLMDFLRKRFVEMSYKEIKEEIERLKSEGEEDDTTKEDNERPGNQH